MYCTSVRAWKGRVKASLRLTPWSAGAVDAFILGVSIALDCKQTRGKLTAILAGMEVADLNGLELLSGYHGCPRELGGLFDLLEQFPCANAQGRIGILKATIYILEKFDYVRKQFRINRFRFATYGAIDDVHFWLILSKAG
jgi:hypothetical protein